MVLSLPSLILLFLDVRSMQVSAMTFSSLARMAPLEDSFALPDVLRLTVPCAYYPPDASGGGAR
jgi:hypothetical protein